jgi:hypothetical protein
VLDPSSVRAQWLVGTTRRNREAFLSEFPTRQRKFYNASLKPLHSVKTRTF